MKKENNKEQKTNKGFVAVIRIKGQIGLRKGIVETLHRLNIRKKYSCVIFYNPSKEIQGMIKKSSDFTAYGEINKETLKELIEKRAQLIDKTKKINVEDIIKNLENGKKLKELNLKPFFRLHPPRKGINTKSHFSQGGVLGNHKEKLNELIERML